MFPKVFAVSITLFASVHAVSSEIENLSIKIKTEKIENVTIPAPKEVSNVKNNTKSLSTDSIGISFEKKTCFPYC